MKPSISQLLSVRQLVFQKTLLKMLRIWENSINIDLIHQGLDLIESILSYKSSRIQRSWIISAWSLTHHSQKLKEANNFTIQLLSTIKTNLKTFQPIPETRWDILSQLILRITLGLSSMWKAIPMKLICLTKVSFKLRKPSESKLKILCGLNALKDSKQQTS